MITIKRNFFIPIAFGTLIFTSCQKAKFTEDSNQGLVTMSSQQDSIQVVTFQTNHGLVKVLKFPSWNAFDKKAKSLQLQVNQLDDNFVNANAQLNERQLNDLEESLNPNFELPLDDFENQYQFTSYRRGFNEAMNNWLGQATLDLSQSPKNKTLFSGAELSLLNPHQQVMIGDTLYHLTGTKYAVITGNYSKGIDFVLDNPDATTFTGDLSTSAWWFIGASPGCTLWKKEGIEPYVTSNRKIYTSCGIRSFTVYCKFLAEVESYEKKNNKWKKYRTNLTAYLTGSSRNINCTSEGSFPMDYKSDNKKEVQANTTVWGTTSVNSSYRAENGASVYGQFTYHGTSSTYVLSW